MVQGNERNRGKLKKNYELDNLRHEPQYNNTNTLTVIKRYKRYIIITIKCISLTGLVELDVLCLALYYAS